MRSIGSLGQVSPFRFLGGDCIGIATSVVIDGSGDATLSNSLKGLATVARATNTYTITIKATWALTLWKDIQNPVAATINCPITVTESAGTIALAFSAGVTSITVPVFLIVSTNTKA